MNKCNQLNIANKNLNKIKLNKLTIIWKRFVYCRYNKKKIQIYKRHFEGSNSLTK